MNSEKQIALTIQEAQKMREASYDSVARKYKLSDEHCLIEAGKKHELSINMWHLLSLAFHWWNDIQAWSEDVLAGKNILKELEKDTKDHEQEITGLHG